MLSLTPQLDEVIEQELWVDDNFTATDRRALIEIGINLGNLTTAVAEMKESMKDQVRDHKGQFDGLDGRIRQLENFRWWILGGSAAFGLLGHVILQKLGL